MKKLLILVVLVLIASMAYSQAANKFDGIRNRAGTLMTAYKFAPKTDTSQAVSVAGYNEVCLVLKTRDSLSIAVYYSPSWDGVTFSSVVLIDSMSSDANGGQVDVFVLPEEALAFPSVKFSWIISAFREGLSNDTLDMKVFKRW